VARLVATGAAGLLLASCGGEPAAVLVTPPGGATAQASVEPGSSPAPASSVPGGAPAVAIEEPADGATVRTGTLTVRAAVSGFTIGAPATGAGAPSGKLIFYIDVDFVPTDPGKPALTSPGTFQRSSAAEVAWPDVGAGRHALFVQLVNPDDTPLIPPATARSVITASASGTA
jgi:hypothetical protein